MTLLKKKSFINHTYTPASGYLVYHQGTILDPIMMVICVVKLEEQAIDVLLLLNITTFTLPTY